MVKAELESIAAEDGWFDLGRRLDAAMANPDAHGCATADDVLRTVASLRRQHPQSLKRTVRGARALLTAYPDVAAAGNLRAGLTHVLLLDQLRGLGAPLTRHFTLRVLSGRVSQRALEKQVAEARAAAEAKARDSERPYPPGQQRVRSRAFEAAVRDFVERNPGIFADDPSATVTSGYKLRPVPFDLALWSNGELVAAVEAKYANVRTYPKQIVEILGTLQLMTLVAPRVWLVIAPEWEQNLSALQDIHRQLKMNTMNVGVLSCTETGDDDRNCSIQIHELSTIT
jgi:hypothetical protein